MNTDTKAAIRPDTDMSPDAPENGIDIGGNYGSDDTGGDDGLAELAVELANDDDDADDLGIGGDEDC